jgi:hypothetical protein
MTTKEKEAIYQKQYRLDNKEGLAKQKKQYYLDNKEEILKKAKQYGLENKQEIAKQKKQYRFNNKEEQSIYQKQYRFNNKEELKEKYNLLPDFVLRLSIKRSLKNKGLEITQEMMDIKKLTILLKRELKQLNN